MQILIVPLLIIILSFCVLVKSKGSCKHSVNVGYIHNTTQIRDINQCPTHLDLQESDACSDVDPLGDIHSIINGV